MCFRLLVNVVVLLLLAGCAATEVARDDKRIYWPKPPDSPRFVYEATLRSEESIKAVSATDRLKLQLTGVKKKEGLFIKPLGVAARGGRLVVTDPVLRIGVIIDLPQRKIFQFGKLGPQQGVLVKPMGLALDANLNIYVADVGRRQILVFDAVGMYLRSIGAPDDLDRPVDVAVSADGARVYVVDAGGIDSARHRVVIYGGDGKKLAEIGHRGTEPGEFNLPTHIALGPDNTMYVLDTGNFRIQAFSPEGQFLKSWGAVGRNFGDLARPRGLAVDTVGNIYVSDAAYRNVQVFSPDGELLLALGGEGLTDEPGQFALPAGVAVDDKDYIYIVDQLFVKIDVLRRLSDFEVAKLSKARGVKP